MKKQLLRAFTMLVVITTLAFVTAMASNAQSKGRQLSANVPFQFIVGDREMPAGQYRIGGISQESDAGIAVRRADRSRNSIRLSNSVQAAQPAKQSMLVFHRYGDKSYLAEIWTAGNQEGRALLKSKSERILERELAASEQLASIITRETVTVIASVE